MSKKPLLSAALQRILKKGKETSIPQNIAPMLATLVTEPVSNSNWVYEMKWDGYRTLVYINNGTVNLCSRNNKSFNEKYYPLTQAFATCNINAVFDGEIVVLNQHGIPDFANLQLWRSEADGHLIFYAFDLLWYEGVSVMHLPLEERRLLLEAVLPQAATMRMSENLRNNGNEAFAQAQQLQLEGVMAKKLGSIYTPGSRSKDWLKIKTEKRQELVIGGYTKNEGTKKLFSSLLLGIFENGQFNFVTPVGTGFNHKMQQQVLMQLQPLQMAKSPFATEPEYNKPSRFRPHPPKAEVTWVQPRVVVEISYRELTSGGAIRQPSFKGLRPDKSPQEVVREVPQATTHLLSQNKLTQQKIIAAPEKKQRATLLNPTEETQTRNVNGHDLRFTNLSKLFWPKEKISKRDMINYYYQVAPFMLTYMKDRPQILNRHPNGIEGKSFYQKDVKGKAPDWITTFPYYSYADEREKEFLVCTNEASLLYIASLGCIEMNPWHSRMQKPDNPDWCIIDIDPDKNSFEQVIEAANVTKAVLDAVDVACYCKTSGSTGLHIYIPLGAQYNYEVSKEFGRIIAKIVHQQIPGFTSIERKTADRSGKMYIDFLQNRPQASVAAPYALRPKPGATVSMPLHWTEVKAGLQMKDFTIKNAVGRLREQGDIFKAVLGKGINLKKVLKKMQSVYDIAVEKKAFSTEG